MATIYRFIVEQKSTGGGGGRKSSADSGVSKKTTAKKGRAVSLFGGEKGGVEHNRKLRAINPLINRATHGYWEKGMRLGRAGLGLIQVDSETGAFAGLSGTAIAIIVALCIQSILKIQNIQREKAKSINNQNFRMLENGVGAVHGDYEVNVNLWNNRATYNQNK